MELEFERPDRNESLSIIANDKVCYAYYLVNDEIVGDVWLYNLAPLPTQPEWSNPESLPYVNSIEFGDAIGFVPREEDFQVLWDSNPDVQKSAIYIRQKLHAILEVGEKPGRCVLAKKDGPLAKVLK